jgi:secreted trypsin-like serine protease
MTVVPIKKITYECNRIPNECGCSLSNVVLSHSNQKLSSTNENDEDAYPYSWSMLVSIRTNDTKHLCTGTILSDTFILTAAQCVFNGIKSHHLTVAAGIHSLSQYITSIHKVAQIYIHENYTNNATHLHDIAILRLESPLELKTQPLFSKTCLSSINLIDSIEDSSLVTVGWRHSIVEENTPNTIQQMSIQSIINTNSTCFNSIYNVTYQFCAGLKAIHTGRL